MHDLFPDRPSPFDSFDRLLAPPTIPADGTLRERLLERTLGELRARRRWRRLGVAAALAACYATGVLTMRWALAPTPPTRPSNGPPEARRALPPRPEAAASVGPSGLKLEWQALDGPGGRPEPYQRAGDRYLEVEGDPESALRCYGGALDEGGPGRLALAPGDNWLLTAIKDARKKENVRCED